MTLDYAAITQRASESKKVLGPRGIVADVLALMQRCQELERAPPFTCAYETAHADAAGNCVVEFRKIEAERNNLKAETDIDNRLLAERNRLLNLFECPEHGDQCIPHAIEEVTKMRAENAALKAEVELLTKGHGYTALQDAHDQIAKLREAVKHCFDYHGGGNVARAALTPAAGGDDV